jgi:hypothetical protein
MVQEIANRFATTDGGHAPERLPTKPGLFAEVMGDAQKGVNMAMHDTGKQVEFNQQVAKTNTIDFAKAHDPMVAAQESQDNQIAMANARRLTSNDFDHITDRTLRYTA